MGSFPIQKSPGTNLSKKEKFSLPLSEVLNPNSSIVFTISFPTKTLQSNECGNAKRDVVLMVSSPGPLGRVFGCSLPGYERYAIHWGGDISRVIHTFCGYGHPILTCFDYPIVDKAGKGEGEYI